MRVVTVGTRRSRLALAQTGYVCHMLRSAGEEVETQVVPFTTEGDRLAGALDSGGKGLFTAALERAIVDGRIDCAVHSLKDLPVQAIPDVTVGAVLDRKTARDVLMTRSGFTLNTLPRGASVGTASRRRRAQLKAHRPDLVVHPVRGNVDTRIRKMQAGEVDALVLAQAGLYRLGIEHDTHAVLPLSMMLPAPGQGALAVQCRADSNEMLALLKAIDCADTRQATTAERTFLSALGGGCAAPIAAWACLGSGDRMVLQGMVASPNGERVVRVEGEGTEARPLGARLAREALRLGAAEVLRAA